MNTCICWYAFAVGGDFLCGVGATTCGQRVLWNNLNRQQEKKEWQWMEQRLKPCLFAVYEGSYYVYIHAVMLYMEIDLRSHYKDPGIRMSCFTSWFSSPVLHWVSLACGFEESERLDSEPIFLELKGKFLEHNIFWVAVHTMFLNVHSSRVVNIDTLPTPKIM